MTKKEAKLLKPGDILVSNGNDDEYYNVLAPNFKIEVKKISPGFNGENNLHVIVSIPIPIIKNQNKNKDPIWNPKDLTVSSKFIAKFFDIYKEPNNTVKYTKMIYWE